ncbi:MAG: cob(I)yrinic acid a,c-diamide adenosyltransferase [Spirochaetaceae bacterium]|nr:cob(I)yrinic acid a,c-diamide adenosyltransferase [Spirochaetaceae bacterium]
MGLLLVFTGNGKGKTTAALGQVFRALGRGWKCCVLQFIKSGDATGESLFARGQELLDFKSLGLGFVLPGDDTGPHRKAAEAAWSEAERAVSSGVYRLVVLDELTHLCGLGFLGAAEILRVLRERPSGVHVVVTGREAPPELIAAADIVTEMREVKHSFSGGRAAEEGIEY